MKKIKKLSGTNPLSPTELIGEARIVFQNNLPDITDEQSQGHFLMTSYVLAAYRILLRRGWKIRDAYSVLAEAFRETGKFWIRWPARISLLLVRDRMALLYRMSRLRAKTAYGASFSIDHEPEEDGGFTSVVRRCGYFDFFARNGVPELTRVLCDWDDNWTKEIKPARHGVVFSRPATIAGGSSACRFEFRAAPSNKNRRNISADELS